MIAASQRRYDSSLRLVQLALQLRQEESLDSIPEPLRERFMEIAQQAAELISDPAAAASSPRAWSPEAISLALILRREENAAEAGKVCSLSSFEQMTRTNAKNLLNSIHCAVAP